LPPGLPQANLGKITTFQIEVCDPSQCMAAKGQLTWTGIPVSEPSVFAIGSQEFQEQRAACFLFRQIIWMNGIPAGLSGVVQYFSQYANYLGGCNFTDQDKATLLRILFGDKTVSSAP